MLEQGLSLGAGWGVGGAELPGSGSRSAFFLIHTEVSGGAGRKGEGISAERFIKNRMLSHAEYERPVTRCTKAGNRASVSVGVSGQWSAHTRTHTHTASLRPAAHDERGVDAAEAEGVRQADVERVRDGLVGHVVETALGVGVF